MRLGRGEASVLDSCLEKAFKARPLHEINGMIRAAVEKKIIERVYEQS
jgi:hypothetical protein